jgi:hypothetical protein
VHAVKFVACSTNKLDGTAEWPVSKLRTRAASVITCSVGGDGWNFVANAGNDTIGLCDAINRGHDRAPAIP